MPRSPTPRPELDALLAACIEHPGDDAPRLVLADWLEEHGEADRAEFIRLQIESARLDDYDPRRDDLVGREEALLETHEKTWVADLPAWARRSILFQRGLVGHIYCSAEQFLKSGSALRKLAPIQAVHLDDTPGHFAEL